MRSPNPFSPAFGVTPNMFFGRAAYLDLVRAAMGDVHSSHRAFFIEGTRGSGKTVLLHEMAQLARQDGWLAFELQSMHAAQVLQSDLAETLSSKAHPAIETTISLPMGAQLSLSGRDIAGQGADASHGLLVSALLEVCSSLGDGRGAFIAIDEAQKISPADAVEICSAFQAARIRGLNVMLVFAGLPTAKQRISSVDGCTFLRRAPREVLRLLGKSETTSAFAAAFSRIPEMELTEEQIYTLAHASQGHPYLMQLLGYNLYEDVDMIYGASLDAGGSVTPGEGEIGDAMDRSFWTYRDDVLNPTIGGLGKSMRAYLEALIRTMDSGGLMSSGNETARIMGKNSASELSTTRGKLIDLCIIEERGYGKLRFMLPYIPRYFAAEAGGPLVRNEDDWDVEL